ncbi:MAG: DUF6029 family protein [Candidatus Alcyoniella australis]|nr:DUF6029 family protein [Candidatus Alcyoniella australis]
MRLRSAALIAVLALLLAAAPAQAFKFKTPVTDAVNINNNLKLVHDQTTADLDQHFWALINRLNLQVKKGALLVGLRYDVETFLVGEETEFQGRYTVRKFFIEANKRPVRVRLGDSFVQEGRGLAFALKKVDEFGEDTTLQGALLEVNNDWFNYGSFAGSINPLDEDEVRPNFEFQGVGEPPKLGDLEDSPPDWPDRDLAWGGHTGLSLPGWFTAAGHYAAVYERIDPEVDPVDFEADDTWQTLSLSLDMPNILRHGAFYAEYAWLELRDRKRPIPDELSEGRGGYASAVGYAGPLTMTFEYKDYFLFEHPYSEPPSLENPKVAFGETPHYDDEIGGRLGAQYDIPLIDVNGSLSYLHVFSHEELPADLQAHYDLSKRVIEHETKHVWGGLDKTFDNAAFVFAHGGYREKPDGRWVHGELDGGAPIYGPHSFTAAFHVKTFYGWGLQSDTEYGSELYQLGYAFSPYVSLTGSYERSDEPQASAGSGGAQQIGSEEPDENFWSIEALVQPLSQASVKLFYGRQKGGVACSAGMCREVPSFEGFKMELALRF